MTISGSAAAAVLIVCAAQLTRAQAGEGRIIVALRRPGHIGQVLLAMEQQRQTRLSLVPRRRRYAWVQLETYLRDRAQTHFARPTRAVKPVPQPARAVSREARTENPFHGLDY